MLPPWWPVDLKVKCLGVVHLGILGGGVLPGSPNPDPISDQKCHFPHPFSDLTSKIHTCFQTWPLGRNYVIIGTLSNDDDDGSENVAKI